MVKLVLVTAMIGLAALYFAGMAEAESSCIIQFVNLTKRPSHSDVRCKYRYTDSTGSKAFRVPYYDDSYIDGYSSPIPRGLVQQDMYSKDTTKIKGFRISCRLGQVSGDKYYIASDDAQDIYDPATDAGVDCTKEKICVILSDHKPGRYQTKFPKNGNCDWIKDLPDKGRNVIKFEI